MEHYVTWSELLALLTLLITFASLLYAIFHDDHKKKYPPSATKLETVNSLTFLNMGATVCRYALSIFIIRIFLRFVKGQTGVFFGFAVLTIFGRVCYNKALGHTENGGRFRFLLPRIYIRWEVMLWNIMWLGQNSLRFWHSWLHLQLCCIIFSMTIIKRNNRPSCNCGGYFF